MSESMEVLIDRHVAECKRLEAKLKAMVQDRDLWMDRCLKRVDEIERLREQVRELAQSRDREMSIRRDAWVLKGKAEQERDEALEKVQERDEAARWLVREHLMSHGMSPIWGGDRNDSVIISEAIERFPWLEEES